MKTFRQLASWPAFSCGFQVATLLLGCTIISGCATYINWLYFEFGINENQNPHIAVNTQEQYNYMIGEGKSCSSVCLQNNIDPTSCPEYVKAVRPECKGFIEGKESEK